MEHSYRVIRRMRYGPGSSPAQLPVNREIEHRSIAYPALPIKPKPDGPDLLGPQRPFGAELSIRIPRPPLLGDRIIL
jgi:hypothetical protein